MRAGLVTLQPYLLALASALLFAAAFPPIDAGVLAFVALAPLIVVVQGRTRAAAAVLAWIAGTVGCTFAVGPAIFTAARGYFAGGGATALALTVVLPQLHGALPIALFGLGARTAAHRPVVAVLALPTLWVATEMLRSELGYGVPWVLLAHAVHARLWLVQVADLGGAAAVSWVVACVNAGIALVVLPGLRACARLAVAAEVALVLLVVHAYGTWQLAHWESPPGPHLAVALVQPAVPEAWRGTLAHVPDVLARLQSLTRGVAATHPALVVWPENALAVAIEANPQVIADLADVLDPDARVLLGGSRPVTGGGGPALRNAAFLADRQGRVVDVYEKERLTPFGEYRPWLARPFGAGPDLYAPSEHPKVLALGPHRLGTTICAEAIDAALVRRRIHAGADLLVNLAHDGWFVDTAARAQHLHAAALRAVENRRFLLRATSDGLTAIVDPRGAIVQAAPPGVPATLTASVVFVSDETVYTRWGDVFGWACVLLTMAAVWHERRPSVSRARRAS